MTPARRFRTSPGSAARRALARQHAGTGWQTSDDEELARRRERAASEPMEITALDPEEPFYGTFAVLSGVSGMPYQVEIRSLDELRNSCTCADFRVNGLGTCKHIEAVLNELRGRPRLFQRALRQGSPRAEIYLERTGTPSVRILLPDRTPPTIKRFARRYFDHQGRFLGTQQDAASVLQRALDELPPAARKRLRIANEVRQWADEQHRRASRRANRQAFEKDVAAGKRSFDVVRLPLYEYQRQGMLHLAFGERVLLADDMGLGKTVQAIAACALLRDLRGIQRVLVVSPVSLKTEWREQIDKFTSLPASLISGPRLLRRKQYRDSSFFYLANYEQVLRDVSDINEILAPDVVILDEAQRIKNWSTKTAQAVKRLTSPYAFVLTGTPLENRIDEIYSIVEFLDPSIFGPLFRFNREFYRLDERGRPDGYQNIAELRRRIRPIMLRRRKEEVEDQLPERFDNNYFVDMDARQREPYEEYQARVARLLHTAKRRPLRQQEHQRLQKWLACMRMLCDTTYILDRETRVCPKLPELGKVLDDLGVRNGRKALVFSEWERMLVLVRELAEEMGLGYAWHTGSVPQGKRRKEIDRFKNDPDCKLFLSTDSGGVGLNLQSASVVVNLDLPWNPAKLEQRIARAWRKHQQAPVHVINLVTRDSIEHKMLATLAVKRELAEGVLDGVGDLDDIKMPSGREAFLRRLKLLMGEQPQRQATVPAPAAKAEPASPSARFRQDLLAELSNRIQLIHVGRDETGGRGTLVVVDREPEQVAGVIQRLHRQAFAGTDRENQLEVLDRQTFEVIQRLAGLGLVKIAGGTDIHRSATLAPAGPSAEEKRRQEAGELVSRAERKLDMGRLLAQGGYPGEALAPIHEGVELAIRAMAVLSGGDEKNGDGQHPVATAVIQGLLVGKGLLEAAEAAQVSVLREMAKAGRADEDTTGRLLASGRCIVAKARATLAQPAVA